MTTTNLCLIRHGETDWNAELRVQGHIDIPLNAKGRAQAHAVANALRSQRFDRLYSSDLLRALQTAELTADVLGLPIYRSTALRERHYGDLEGMTKTDFAARYPEDLARMLRRDPEHVIPGAKESLRGFAARAVSALNEIAKRHPGESVLVFTHGGVLDMAYRLVTRKPLEAERDWPLLNCSLNWLHYRSGSWSLVRWAERAGGASGPQTPAAQTEVEGEASKLPDRPAARLLLINHRNEVLLFRYSTQLARGLAAQGHEHFWVSPGGGVEPGETFEEAALRELAEETGMTGVELGPCISERMLPVELDGQWFHAVDRYFAVRVGDFTPDVSGFTDLERSTVSTFKWWSSDEIAASREVIFPEDLADLLRSLTAS